MNGSSVVDYRRIERRERMLRYSRRRPGDEWTPEKGRAKGEELARRIKARHLYRQDAAAAAVAAPW